MYVFVFCFSDLPCRLRWMFHTRGVLRTQFSTLIYISHSHPHENFCHCTFEVFSKITRPRRYSRLVITLCHHVALIALSLLW